MLKSDAPRAGAAWPAASCGRPPAALTLRFKDQGRVIVLIGPVMDQPPLSSQPPISNLQRLPQPATYPAFMEQTAPVASCHHDDASSFC